MDRSVDNYLHKKFKKQLSIAEPKPQPLIQQNDKENHVSSWVSEPSPEKAVSSHKDNNRIIVVPNQSTNITSFAPLTGAPGLSSHNQSSISISESGNSKQCISNSSKLVTQHDDENRNKAVSFDTTTFRPIVTESRGSEATNINNHISCNSPPLRPPTPTEYLLNNLDARMSSSPPQEDQCKNEEILPTPEKNPNGKYVCHYCNLVCSKPSVLQKHIRAHTNERPYPCTSCGFSFKTRSNLYKHCRSRTHANRVMGVKAQETLSGDVDAKQTYIDNATQTQLQYAGDEAGNDLSATRHKPYKPRFHRVEQFDNGLIEDEGNKSFSGTDLSHHINEIISKNNSIVNSSDPNLLKRRLFNETAVEGANNNDYVQRGSQTYTSTPEEPLNLTNKNRKRCMSEATEPVMQKSLIKELLLKNLYSSDMQCPYCKMIFQTVTELECHKMRSCKGKPSEAKYTRSSSVNVASILTKNKNAFDSMPNFQNTVFPLNSPGPFLGKTRLVDGDKNKSFSFDSVNLPVPSPNETSPNYVLSSPTPFKEEKKPHVKLFGGEVKVHTSLGESKSYIIDSKEAIKSSAVENFDDFEGRMNENRVVKSGLQSGGTVLTSKTSKEEPRIFRDVIRVYENSSASPNIDLVGLGKPHFNYELREDGININHQSSSIDPTKVEDPSLQKYPNIADFSQNAVKLLAPNLKHPGIQLSTIVPHSKFVYQPDLNLLSPRQPDFDKVALSSTTHISIDTERETPVKRIVIHKNSEEHPIVSENNIYNPMNLLVNGKVIRYVPGMPGPVAAEAPVDMMFGSNIVAVGRISKDPLPHSPLSLNSPTSLAVCRTSPLIIQQNERVTQQNLQSPSKRETQTLQSKSLPSDIKRTELKPPETHTEPKKFARPTTLALKPTTASLKQHHGLTPTMFNQILISPDTPRVAKKYAQHLFNGNYFSYLGLKSSTKPVYCTLNKTQPFYVPHFKKLSMYSEWRQQDTKVDKLYVSAYDSRQKNPRIVTAGRTDANLIIHSSYKFVVSEVPSKTDKDEDIQKALVGGFECSEESPYIRGRGRGRYVCEQCGIRCKKPSMLKKHIRTHSNDRPYTCSHCNFSFKTKGNLTKHMKSKSHTKNYTATSSGSSTALSMSQSSDSDTDDSGMDSSDESMTRQQEHEAAYGLLSLSQKTSGSPTEMLSSTGSGLLRTASPTTPSATEFMTTEEVAYVSKTSYAKNKILDDLQYKLRKPVVSTSSVPLSCMPIDEPKSKEDSLAVYFGKTSTSRPLTYPYTSPLAVDSQKKEPGQSTGPKSIREFHVIQKYVKELNEPSITAAQSTDKAVNYLPSPVPTLKVNDIVVQDSSSLVQERKRKSTIMEDDSYKVKVHRNSDEVMDLSVTSSEKREPATPYIAQENQPAPYLPSFESRTVEELNYRNLEMNRKIAQFEPPNYQDVDMFSNSSSDVPKQMEYDNSAMETLADVATKQVRLAKNMLAKNVASEYLKLATQNENMDANRDSGCFLPNKKHLNELIARSEGNKSCTICSKSFNKPSQLKLHMNIHYLERPFRCDSCSISFRCRGHLQKHEKSASHNSKLSSSPAQSSSEPRPFKCSDCNIAFRIQGHLAKHLRSKMHIMKLECLSKIPFGLYAELERSNSLLTEINTSDGDQCLESLKTLAKKVFINDPGKLQSIIHEMKSGSNASDPNS